MDVPDPSNFALHNQVCNLNNSIILPFANAFIMVVVMMWKYFSYGSVAQDYNVGLWITLC